MDIPPRLLHSIVGVQGTWTHFQIIQDTADLAANCFHVWKNQSKADRAKKVRSEEKEKEEGN